MTKWSGELEKRVRATRGNRYAIAEVREWYMRKLVSSEDTLFWKDLTAFEQDFMNKAFNACNMWLKMQDGTLDLNS